MNYVTLTVKLVHKHTMRLGFNSMKLLTNIICSDNESGSTDYKLKIERLKNLCLQCISGKAAGMYT